MIDLNATSDARRHPRLSLPPMYTFVRVRPPGKERFCWTGYIYDISASGMRFDLDRALEPGTEVEVRGMLPGSMHTTFQATGRVVRMHDDAREPGPVRMGLTFSAFHQHTDRARLVEYLEHAGVGARKAAA